MSEITIGQISIAISLIVGLISGATYISQSTKKWIRSAMDEQMDGIEGKINTINTRLDQVDLESTKNYLVTFLSNREKGLATDEIEKERFWEQYQHYEKLGGNSYIKRKVEELKSLGLI